MNRYRSLLLCLATLGFIVGCGGSGGGSGNSTSLNSVSSPIGSQGGQLTTLDGVASITIPQGALDNTTTITLLENTGFLPPGGLSSAYEFMPDGLTFKIPVTIRLRYNSEFIPANISESDLKVAFLSNGSWQTVANSSVDTVNKVISAQVSHFTPYVVTTDYLDWNYKLGTFNLVDVYSNGNHENSGIYNIDADGTNTGMKWQCVEYVNRYYKTTYNLDLRKAGEDAKLYYSHASDRGLLDFPNNGSDPPAVGDIIVSEGGPEGHVAIVREVSDSKVIVVQQNYLNNYGDLEFFLARTGNDLGSFGGGLTYPIKGWLRVPFALVQTQPATSVTTSGAILNGSINPKGLASTVWFEWGTNPSLSSPITTSIQNIGSGTANVSINTNLTGLSLGTTYYYRVVRQNSKGTYRGNTLSLTTANPLSMPTVQTQAATSVTAGGATLNGTVNPNGFLSTAWFEWGTSPTLSTYSTTPDQIIGFGTTNVSINAALAGLNQGTTYYFRVAASNDGGTVRGAMSSFTTTSAASITWIKNYAVSDIRQTTDGGYIIVGSSNGIDGISLVKIDSSGNLVWSKTITGATGNAVQQTSDGGYVIAGGTNSNPYDVYIVKTDSSGNLLWSKNYGGLAYDVASSVQQTLDGGYIIGGTTTSQHASGDMYLLRTDSSGNLLWSKTFFGTESAGSAYGWGYAVQQTSDAGFIIAGDLSSSETGVGMGLVKTDSNGNLVWSKTFTGTGTDGGDGRDAQQTTDGGYVIAGHTSYNGGDMYLVKTDSTGNLLWSKTYGGSGFEGAFAVQQTSDAGYVLAGFTRPSDPSYDYSIYIVKTDPTGNLLWSKTYGLGNVTARAIQQTSDGGYILGGDGYVIKADSQGNAP